MNKLDIANIALANIGSSSIASIDEHSSEADAVRVYWNLALEYTLRSHAWHCATRVVFLGYSDNQQPNKDEYAYVYTLPVDCVRLVNVRSKNKYPCYQLFGHKLYCDSVLKEIHYISSAINVSDFDIGFINLFTLKLSELICYRIGGRADLRNDFQGKFESMLISARGQDAREVNQSRPYESTASFRNV